jgi:hypothetical protein
MVKHHYLRSDRGTEVQRGFCAFSGTVLFSHVSGGKEDQYWAMRTGCLVGEPSPKPDQELFMRSKPDWVPAVLADEKQRFETVLE